MLESFYGIGLEATTNGKETFIWWIYEGGAGKFDKVINFLKSALKVVGTLGLDKNAKLEFAAAKFAMNNENANKIKEYSKTLSTTLKTLTQSIKKAQGGSGY